MENTEQSLKLLMHLTNFEKSTGTNFLPPRPIPDTTPWPDPEQVAIARSTVAHGCSLTGDLRQAFLFLEPKGLQHDDMAMVLQVSTTSRVTGYRPALGELLTGP